MASALAVWGVARAFSGRVLLRIEDHDQTRSRPDFEKAILDDLAWLGFAPDEPPVRQSERDLIYRDALADLERSGFVYPCACSRKSIEAAAGPGDGETRYPGTCRDREVDRLSVKSRRLRLAPGPIAFLDLRLGPQQQTPADQCGDILVRDRLEQWTYQFAAAVDDHQQGIDLIIRGEDLLESTGRQIQIAGMLGRRTPARFLHHPLILDPGGQKLSKSRGDTGVRELRAAGWTVERILGQGALALGLTTGDPITQAEIADRIREGAR